MFVFNPQNHYWQRKNGKVYSSLAMQDVNTNDPAFKAWQDSGGVATPYPCDINGEECPAELANVLAPYGQKAYPPTLDEARAAKWQEAVAGYQAVFAKLDAKYPPQERETWPRQEAEARAYMSWVEGEKNAAAPSSAPDTPFLMGLIAARGFGETLDEFAANVIAAQAIFAPFGMMLTGQEQRHYRIIMSELQSVDAVMAYEPKYDLPEQIKDFLGV